MKYNTQQHRLKGHIAILGFAEPCSAYNQDLAFGMGVLLAKRHYVVTAGNLSSTFYCAFKGAKKAHGQTLALIEAHNEFIGNAYCDVVLTVKDVNQKHRMMADLCSSAIIIGGGHGTKHIESEFLRLKKPVVALKDTGGITRTELDTRTQCVSTIQDTLTLIH